MSTDELFQFKNSSKSSFLLRDRYRYVKPLQVGSYGEVILGVDAMTNECVAIKSMSKAQRGSTVIARHELSILNRISHTHQNICSLLDHFETQGYYWMVFEYCSNGDLYDYVANPSNDQYKLHLKTLIKELYQIISHSHSKGIYHRDIKPENILIDSSKSIKLTDWGLSTLFLNASDPLIGTEKYMAPETFFKQSSSNKRKVHSYNTKYADYWSLGITLLYVLFKKCLWKIANISDPNFKKFSEDPSVLFEWYPRLSKFGFTCMMTLLQLNPTYRSLDCFFELSCIKGYSVPFVNDETEDMILMKEPSSVEITELSSSNDDDLLFGMEMENPVVSTFKNHFDAYSVEDEAFDQDEDTEESIFESSNALTYNTPLTPTIQTPVQITKPVRSTNMILENSSKRINGLNPDIIRNSPLRFEKLDWY